MSEKPDLSALLSMMSNTENKIAPEELLQNLMQSATHSSSSSNSNTENSINQTDEPTNTKTFSSDGMPDMETMMKIMQVMKSSNQDTPSKELLKSLKPFLNDSRKEKVDQYIKILGMTKVLEIFNELGDKPK